MAIPIALDYTPPGAVLDAFFWCNEFVSGIRGPIGGGKSTACAFRPWRHLAESEPDKRGRRRARWAIVRNTQPELKTTTIKTWHQWFQKSMGKWTEHGPPTHLIETADMSMEVMFLALDRPDDVRKLLSLELTGAWINEAREVPKAILDALTGRVGRFPPAAEAPQSWSGVIMDTNAPDTDHWWYKLAEEQKPEGFAFFAQPAGDGPDAENLQYLPGRGAYYTRIKAGKAPNWIKVYVQGEYGFVQDGKPVYPEYVDSLHCRPIKPVPGIPIHVGLDFGLTPAATIGQRLANGSWRIYAEVIGKDIGTERFAEVLGPELRGTWGEFEATITGDPAGDQRAQTDETTPFDILKAANIPAKAASTNDFSLRRGAVAGAMTRLIDGEPGFLISPDCTTLRKGLLGGYRYRRVAVAGERYEDKPEKNLFSHVNDACQYMMLGGGEGKAQVRRFRTTLTQSRHEQQDAETEFNVFAR